MHFSSFTLAKGGYEMHFSSFTVAKGGYKTVTWAGFTLTPRHLELNFLLPGSGKAVLWLPH